MKGTPHYGVMGGGDPLDLPDILFFPPGYSVLVPVGAEFFDAVREETTDRSVFQLAPEII